MIELVKASGYGLAAFYSLAIDILCYQLITKEKVHKNVFIFFLIVFLCGVTVFANHSDNSMIKLLVHILSIFIVLAASYRQSFFKTLYYTVILWVILIITELVTTLFISFIGVSSPEEFYDDYFLLKFSLTLIVSTVQAFIILIPIIRRKINELYERIKKDAYSLDLIALSIIGFSLLTILNTFNMDRMGSHYIVILLVIIFCLLIIAILAVLNKKHVLEQENKNLRKNNTTYSVIAENYADLKHNIINQFLSIRSVASDKAIRLIDDRIKEYENQEMITTNIHKIPEGLKGIIFEKVYQYEESEFNITVTNNLKNDPFEVLGSRCYNTLCEALGILMDNALEAAINSQEKIISIEFEDKDGYISIIIINSFDEELDVDLVGTKNYTTKRTGHGLGVHYLLKSRYLKIKNTIINGFYKSEIKIKNK